MARMLKLMCLTLLALTVAGCGKKVLVPEKTVVAAYIDLEKTYDNGKSVADTLIDALPSDERSMAKKGYEEALKIIDKFRDNLDPEWAVITFGGNLTELAENKNHPERIIAVAIKINADEDAVTKVLKDVCKMDDVKSDKKDGHIVFDFGKGKLGIVGDKEEYLGLVDGKYVIYSPSRDAFDNMFDLYAGKGKASDEFDDLSKISGNTICRISTAPVANLLKRFELTREIEKFGDDCEDEDLVDMILNMGPISLDVGVGDELGLALHVNCDSSSDAKTIESLMRSVAFLARLGCDAGAVGAKNHTSFHFFFKKIDIPEEAKDIFINLAQNVEADRSWNVATLSVALETAKLADFIKKLSSENKSNGDGVSGLDDDDDDDGSPLFGSKHKSPVFKSTAKVKKAYDYTYGEDKPASSYYGKSDEVKKADSSYSSYRRNAQKEACISNMKQLQSVAEMYMLNHSSTPTVSDLCGPDKYFRTRPTCPKDGSSYRIYREDGEIKVSCPNAYDGHKL